MSETSPTYRVRPARREDADAFLTLIDALADYEKLDRPAGDARARLLHDGFTLSPPRFRAFLAENTATGEAVGYAIVFDTYSSFLARPTLYIEDIFVRPDARGGGAGSLLFDFLCADAVARGCGRMEWVCLDWNQLAIDFYERRGATHLDDWRYFRLTGEALRRRAQKAKNNAETDDRTSAAT